MNQFEMNLLSEAVAHYQTLWNNSLGLEYPAITDATLKDEIVDHLVDFHPPVRGDLNIAGHMVSRNGTKATKADLLAWHERIHSVTEVTPDNYRVVTDGSYDARDVGHHWGWKPYEYTRDGEVKTAYVNLFLAPKAVVEESMVANGEWNQIARRIHQSDKRALVVKDGVVVRHTHAAPVVLPEVRALADKATGGNKPVGEKPLSAAEAKALSDVINNDFSGLKNQMKAFAADTLTQRQAEVNAEWDASEKALPDFAGQATKALRKKDEEVAALKAKHAEALRALVEKHDDAIAKVEERAKDKGVVLKTETRAVTEMRDGQPVNVTRHVYVAQAVGRSEALAGVKTEVDNDLQRALMTLEQQRLAAQRQVLVSRVNPEAAKLLDTIPTAQEAMIAAYGQQAAKQIEAKQS